jgi:hypothetical protein
MEGNSYTNLLARRVGLKLGTYVNEGGNGDVAKLFNIFINYLQTEGAVILMQDVIGAEDDDALHQLHDHLVDGILKPCENIPSIVNPRVHLFISI